MEKKLRLDISYSMVPEVLGITEKLCFTGKIHRQLVEGLLGRFYWEWLKLEHYFGSFYKKRINHKDFHLSTTLNLDKIFDF
jgi:hypothetical protein